VIRSKLVALAHAALFGVAALLASGAARADLCAFDQRPGASLLIPYFEVDLAGTPGQGRNTRVWVRNTATRPRLTNVVLWTNWGIPAFTFNVYLPAYGTQRIDIGAIFLQGKLPQTGSAITPVGAFDSVGTPLVFNSCNTGTTPGEPPIYTDLSAGAQIELRARYRGTVTSNGQCFAANLGDEVARGYITVDDATQCSTGFSPADPGYLIAGGFGVASNANVLLGGAEYVHPANNFAHATPAFPVEASDVPLFVPGDPTFYGRYMAYTAGDSREPLPFSWTFEFDSEATPENDNDDADLQLFRVVPRTNTRSCAGVPPWYPLFESERVPFDRAGNTPAADPFPLGETLAPMGRATQLFGVENIDNLLLDPLPRAGSGRLNLTNFQGNLDGQSMLSVIHTWQGRYSESTLGRALDSGCAVNMAIPARVSGPLQANPNTLKYIFADGFSS